MFPRSSERVEKAKIFGIWLFPYPRKIYRETHFADWGLASLLCLFDGAIGVDLDFAKIVLGLRKDLPITLEIAVPCPNQDLKWNVTDKKKYERIIKKADKVSLISDSYSSSCMQKRNEYMVDNSDIVLAVWNGEESGGTWNTISYAKKLGKPMTIILLQEIVKAEKESKERNWQALCKKLGIKK